MGDRRIHSIKEIFKPLSHIHSGVAVAAAPSPRLFDQSGAAWLVESGRLIQQDPLDPIVLKEISKYQRFFLEISINPLGWSFID